jgi:hypothetical protein
VFVDVTALTQRFCIGDLSQTIIGEANFMMGMPSIAEQFAALLTSPIGTDIKMPFLAAAEQTGLCHDSTHV